MKQLLKVNNYRIDPGRSPQGERGLKRRRRSKWTRTTCRSPQGERGLKRVPNTGMRQFPESLPARGAWVETARPLGAAGGHEGRSPQGERGLKRLRGRHERRAAGTSRPARGAWVETESRRIVYAAVGSLPARGAWVETHTTGGIPGSSWSLPARGAWVETRCPRRSWNRCGRSLPARGAWVETSLRLALSRQGDRRSPQGERGLKLP